MSLRSRSHVKASMVLTRALLRVEVITLITFSSSVSVECPRRIPLCRGRLLRWRLVDERQFFPKVYSLRVAGN